MGCGLIDCGHAVSLTVVIRTSAIKTLLTVQLAF